MIILVLLLAHLLFLINTQFTLWPEMVVYPYLVNHDFLLYRDIINPYPPLLLWFLAIFAKIFGYSPLPYQILTWIIILIIDLSIYIISQKVFKNRRFALSSVAFFAVLSIPFGVNGLWFDLVQTPLILWALYFFYQFLNSKARSVPKLNLFVSFLFLTIAFFIKQQVFWVGLLFLILSLSKYKFNILKFIKNYYLAVLPFCVLLLFHIFYFTIQGTGKDFVFWVFNFPLIASRIPGYVLIPSMRQLLLVLAFFGLFAPIIIKKSHTFFLLTATILLLFAYPRFDYFHLVPTIAVISVMFGLNIDYLVKSSISTKGIFLIAVIFLGLFTLRYSQNHWQKEVRFFEQDVFENARVIDLLVEENEKVYLQNAPDQLLPLSGTLPTKPWVDDFPWYLEVQNLQDTIVDSLEKDKSEYIIFRPYVEGGKFGLGSYRPKKIVSYVETHYSKIGEVSAGLVIKRRKD